MGEVDPYLEMVMKRKNRDDTNREACAGFRNGMPLEASRFCFKVVNE